MKKNAAVLTLLLLVLGATGPLTRACAQTPGPGAGDGVRFGVSLGGVSTVGVTVELYRDARSVDLTVGTWSFRDLSVSSVVRQYFGAGRARPVLGAGLWLVGARPTGSERTGWALTLRVPAGVDWEFAESHAAGVFINVNRGLLVRRSDPDDDLPMNNRLVPLPELYYRYAR